jgi:hypothetical protein
LQLGQLTVEEGISVDMVHILFQVEKGIDARIIDQLYATTTLPTNYRELKEKIIALDEMWRRRTSCQDPMMDAVPMQVDHH